MKKRLKAFTLIECIIAMAILAVSSMLLVQAYSALASVSNKTSENNNSIYLQMQDAESPAAAEGKTDGVKPVKITTDSTKKTFEIKTTIGGVEKKYTTKVDVYVVSPYGTDDYQKSVSGSETTEYNRYIYFHS
ncbi:MAG: type II secretion system protein [Huintestinicola sp.]|uniref:type II secretion system protein n=1 Tax=Huintestinicola sp. TaxID=2981661 RepID=UPI003F11F02E